MKENSYIDTNCTPVNRHNVYLHDHWEPWARRNDIKRYFVWGVWHPRNDIVLQYSCSIPNETALNTIARYGPVIEVGSGSGYWAYLLRLKNVDIIAVDNGTESIWNHENRDWMYDWFPDTVNADGLQYISERGGFRDRTLLLCWPRVGMGCSRGESSVCPRSLSQIFTGDHLIIIARPSIDPIIQEMRQNREWRLIRVVDLPVWTGWPDRLFVYTRRSRVD